MFLNPKKTFQSLRSEYFLRQTWKFQEISYFTDLRQPGGAKKYLKTVLKTRLKTKETTYILVFGKTSLFPSEATQLEQFQCFWKIQRNLTCWKKSKNIFGLEFFHRLSVFPTFGGAYFSFFLFTTILLIKQYLFSVVNLPFLEFLFSKSFFFLIRTCLKRKTVHCTAQCAIPAWDWTVILKNCQV
jgi:hypothetical protein